MLQQRLGASGVVVLGLVLSTSTGAQVRVSPRDAESMNQKVAAIAAHAAGDGRQERRTTLTEAEVNSYLAYELADQLPAGLTEPTLSALGAGRISGRAIVDLDAVRKSVSSSGLFDPRSYLTGRVPVTVAGVLHASEGRGRFELESASVGVVPIPKVLLQEIVSHYTKSPDKPNGIGLEDEFELPAGIRAMQIERGQAIVVQ